MMASLENKTTYKTVDILKFLFCLCIIGLHTGIEKLLPGSFWINRVLFRLAVPFFFVASGYFLSSKCRTKGVKESIMKYCKRLMSLLIVFSVIWIIQYIIDGIIAGDSAGKIALETLQLVVFCPKGALWYIWASIIGALMLLPFIKKDKLGLAVAVGAVLYVFALLCNNYYFFTGGTALRGIVDTYTKICIGPNNGVFVGFIMLAMGFVCERYGEKIKLPASVLLAITAMALYVLEIWFVRQQSEHLGDEAFYLTQLLIAPSLFVLAAKLNVNISQNAALTMRHLSTGMYLLHVPLLWFYNRGVNLVLPKIPVLNRFCGLLSNTAVRFVAIVFITMLICLLAYKYSKRVKKYLM